MTNWFRSLPIRRKLVATTAATTSAALLLAGGGFLIWDVLAFRTLIQRDVATQYRVLTENVAPALVFDDDRAAGETIAALELRPRVVMGCVYRTDGRLFATYHREPGRGCPPHADVQASFGWRTARFVTPITYGGSRMGVLFIERDLIDAQERMLVGLLIVAGLIVLCTFVALGVGVLLQRSIVEPMLQLAETARAVSDAKQVDRRVVPASNDEVGIVIHAFNDMLDRIAERTAALSRANEELQREVDERKRVEGERTILLAREQHANRLKDEFLATLSHELRTPLNAVLGWARVLRTTTVAPDTHGRALETIERNARAQARLIDDLLEVSRIVTGKLRLQVCAADLAAIVDAAVDVVQPAAAAKRLSLRVGVDSRPAMTFGDPDRLQQVVWNLLSNAVKFTPAGGEVLVTLRRSNGYVLTVRDNGIGIEAAFLPHMFEPFRQADGSSSREHGGLGLGLAIVRQIVELHGGTVKAQSGGRDAGSSFEVHLPSEVPSERSAPKRETQILDRAVPDVLVSDLGMPFEDGYALIKRMRRRTAGQGGRVPAVALTAYASPNDRLAALAAGSQAHVSKPYEPADVVMLVERLSRAAEMH